MKPTFLGLGAQKCASTWLHRVLTTHPDVVLPEVKELNFFSHYYDHGYQWYERLFDGCVGARCTGEVSPSYFHDPAAPSRVRRYREDMKLLVTLRDPAERAISNHRHDVRMGNLRGDDLSFEAGLANNPMYIEQGLYAKHLNNWLRFFPAEQIHVVLVDDIEADPARVAREVFDYLGIEASYRPAALTQRFNRSFANRSQSLVRWKDRIYNLSQSPGMGWLWSTAAGIGARDLYRRLNVAESESVIPPVCPGTIEDLHRRFAPDVRELQSLLGRDLSSWLGGSQDKLPERLMTGAGE